MLEIAKLLNGSSPLPSYGRSAAAGWLASIIIVTVLVPYSIQSYTVNETFPFFPYRDTLFMFAEKCTDIPLR